MVHLACRSFWCGIFQEMLTVITTESQEDLV